jgi:DNA-binding CsgD family transcriptional regulator
MGGGDSQSLLERREEKAAIAELLARAATGDGGVLLIEGPAGIGKSRLIDTACVAAHDSGMTICFARAGDLEQDFAFGVARQLYEHVLADAPGEERERLLAGAAAAAAPLLGCDIEQSEPPDEAAAQLALHTLVSRATSAGPLAILVDDAHWGDRPSLAHLAYLARRVASLRIALIVATRPVADREDARALEEIALAGATTLKPRPLSRDATAALAADLLAHAPGGRFVDACHGATGGNPFLLRELFGELVRRGVAPSDEAAASVSHLGAAAVGRAVLLRLSPLGDDAVALAGAVAVLGGIGELRHARAIARLDRDQAATAADALAAAGIFARAQGLAFEHALLREAVYTDMPNARRELQHARAAEVLAADAAAPERIAAHLLQCEPDKRPWAVHALRDAARAAESRGAPDMAATYLRRALAEPPPVEERGELLAALGSAEARVGGPDALAPLREALELAAGPQERLTVALELARALSNNAEFGSATQVLEGVREEAEDLGEAWVQRLDVALIGIGLVDLDSRSLALQRVGRYRADAATLDDARLLASLGGALITSGAPVGEAVEVARRALAAGALDAREAQTLSWAAGTLTWADELEDAEREWDSAVRFARDGGSDIGFAHAASYRSHTRWRRGDVRGAEVDARASLAVLIEGNWTVAVPFPLAFLIDALVERGAIAEATSELAAAGDFPPPLLDSFGGVLLRIRRARVAEACGDASAALDDLLAAGERLDEVGLCAPTAMFDWRSRAAGLLAALGETTRARELAAEELGQAQAQAAPGAIGIAERALALATPDATERIVLLRRSAATLDQAPRPLELARTLLQLGTAERVAGHRAAAREPLRRALDLADRCGAVALSERAREELVVAGARPRRAQLSGIEALTPAEQRVAALAAAGRSNREIAGELFITQKTVEMHLRSAYRKLDVKSRTDLPAALAA